MKKPISKKRKLLYGFLAFIAVCWLVATLGEILDPTVKPKEIPTPVQEVATVFDIPSLLGKNVDQIKAMLGSPLDDSEPTAQQLEFGAEEWQKEFEKSGYTLLVTYNPRTRVVLDFFMPTKDPSGLTTDKTALLRAGGLEENSEHYKIDFVSKRSDASRYTGVKVVPQ